MVRLLKNLFRSFFKMDKQTKDAQQLARRKAYTKDLRTVIEKESEYISSRREKARKEYLVAELPRLEARLATADGEKLEQLKEKIQRIEEWLGKEKALYQGKAKWRALKKRQELKEKIQRIEEWLQAEDDVNREKLGQLKERMQGIEEWLEARDDLVKETLKQSREKIQGIEEWLQIKEDLDKANLEEFYDKIRAIREWLQTEDDLVGSVNDLKRLRGEVKRSFEECEECVFPDQTVAERRPIGLAFSGGGIRSATFNLGLLQGLAKYGFLPWIDYLVSISGGGVTAACMTTLLSMDKKDEKGGREYYYFNTQWDYFPLNPEVKVFDSEGVANVGEPTGDIGPRLKKGANAQLAYLRDKANWVIPRMGWATRDVLRGVGGVLVRISYTVFIFLLGLVAFSAFHYGLTAALTPSITDTIDLHTLDVAALVPTNRYLWTTLGCGIVFSFLIGLILAILYRSDPTREYKLQPWESPRKDVSKETYLAINTLRTFAGVSFLTLLLLTLGLWGMQYRMLAQPGSDLVSEWIFYWAWALLFALLTLAAGWFVLKYTKDYSWVERGLPEQLRVDTLVMYTATGLFIWTMPLLIAWLRFQSFQENSCGPQIFWIWLPTVFTLGSLIGLVLFRNLPLRQLVEVTKGSVYDVNSVGWVCGQYFRHILRMKPDPKYESVASKGVGPYTLSIWSNPEFRSIFSSLQGLVLYGLSAFLVLAFLVVPHYFLVKAGADSSSAVTLAAFIISTGWAKLIASVSGEADSKAKNLIAKIITVPGGLRSYVLGLLVIVLNLLMIFLIQTQIDRVPLQSYWIGMIAVGLLCISGKFADFNYLGQHYFLRDRIAEVAMKTEVETKASQVKVVRDDHQERLLWITPKGCSAPYHIVFTTLNLAGSWYLKLKDRKSQPFIFSKYYCGSGITGYAKTHIYRGGATKYSRAIALSGAGLSPGAGLGTFFAQAFMVTLLNMRFGLWIISPEQYKLEVLGKYARPHQREKIVFWPTYLWDEAKGRISERRPLIKLTDGEYTGDTIGLYPLFQRRCKVIIAGDGSGGPEGRCEGLFCAIHQVKVDLGIEVDINVEGTKPAEYDREKNVAEPSQRHFAVGKITYPETFDASGNQVLPKQEGWLIYFRPAVTRRDPGSILNYWETHKMDFPVPTTADQFFEEEQHEALRSLGEITVEHTLQDLKSYYEEKVKGEEAPAASDKLEFLKELLDNRRIDFDFLAKYPKLIEEFMDALYTISTGTGAKAEEEEGQAVRKTASKRKLHRDAATGRFVTEEYVRKHPKTTVTETMNRPKENE